MKNGNRKLIPIVARHGPGIQDNGYICLNMNGSLARIQEIGTIRKIKKNEKNRAKGFPDAGDVRSEDEGSGEDF